MAPDPFLPPERVFPHQRYVAAHGQVVDIATGWWGRARRLWRRWLVVVSAGVAIAVAGGAAAATLHPTKGPVPEVHGTPDFAAAPDFISVSSGGKVVGFVPRRYVIPQRAGAPSAPSVVAPVFGSNLKTVVGHLYPGVGYVALGTNPNSVECKTISVYDGSATTSTIPCPSVVETVPDIIGLSTPAGVVQLEERGLLANVVNAHSSVPRGHIVRVSPAAGSREPARTEVTVVNSLGPSG